MKYADAQGFKVAVVAGSNEWEEGRCQVKVLATKETHDVSYTHDAPDELVSKLAELI